MAIKGSLTEASLSDVVQLLALGRKTGCLAVTHRHNFGAIYFDQGQVSYASIVNRRDRLGDLLVKSGVLSPEQLDEAIALQAKSRGTRLGELLVEQGMIGREQLNAQMRVQIEEAVYFLLTWSAGAFNFEPEIRPDPQDFVVSLNPEALLLEGARRVDEWSVIERKVPSFDLVFALDRRRLAEGQVPLTSAQETLVPLIDGRRDVTALVEASGLVEFEVGKALFGLATAGYLHQVGRSRGPEGVALEVRIEEHRNLGTAYLRAGMLDDAVRELRRVTAVRPDDLPARFHLGLAHLRLGEWLEAQTEFAAAARHPLVRPAVFHNLALALEKLGHDDEARAALAQAVATGGHEDPRVHVSLGVLALRRGDLAAADAHLREARSRYGTRPPPAVWFHAAALAAALAGEVEQAVVLLTEGTTRYPHAAALHNNLAVALRTLGRDDEGVQALERGLRADSGLAPLQRNAEAWRR